MYISGLIGRGDRKRIEPMAERLAPDQYDRLHHFTSDGIWDTGPLTHDLDRMQSFTASQSLIVSGLP
ncbi:transposase (plasmid) [Agrobacterium tumefaciens]|uniref:Transposase n=1 Tax=Agrobacterium tumefaciens TaxID=358 RepID=A0AAP9J9H3_AGRTU|nr:transposase [Agrobacterium tumefaciens]QDY97633.2 transposase [Agrobacterium tumefaciens]UXS12757.1 transposase [Agrobacterium tumefaciens]UXS20119.1 transposase [Agrobacterium tumefaciens]UXS27766.1 transposase [Agrobacterium tumefaciens]